MDNLDLTRDDLLAIEDACWYWHQKFYMVEVGEWRDLFQIAITKIWQKGLKYDPEKKGKLKYFWYLICKRIAIDIMKHDSKQVKTVSMKETDVYMTYDTSVDSDLEAQLLDLIPDWQSPTKTGKSPLIGESVLSTHNVVKHWFAGYKYREIAEIYHVSAQCISQTMGLAKESLALEYAIDQ